MEYTLQYLKKGCMEDKCFEIFHVWESIFILLSKDGLTGWRIKFETGNNFPFIILKKYLHCHVTSNMTTEKTEVWVLFFVCDLYFFSRIL